MTKIIKRMFSLFLIICLVFTSTVICIGEIDVVKSYYLLKYEYKSFLDPLTKAGATEDGLIRYFKDIEALLKTHDDLSETTIQRYLKDALLKVSTYRQHRNLANIISGCYSEEIESYLETGIVPPNLRDLYDAIIRALFGNKDEDKTDLVKKYETYLKFYNTNKNDYTALSIKVLGDSLSDALSVLTDRNATNQDITQAISALDSAYEALEEKPDTPGGDGGGIAGGGTGGGAPAGDKDKEEDEDIPELPIDTTQKPVGNGSAETKPDNTESKSFSDVPDTHWGKSAIIYLAERNVVNGFTDGTFRPDELVTREQFAKMLCETFKLPLSSDDSLYSDVESGAWYEKYVSGISQSGLMKGTGDKKFGIGSTLIRQDLAVIAERIIKEGFVDKTFEAIASQNAFSDMSSVSDYAKSAVLEMQKYGIVNGTGANLFTPFGGVTRAQAAQIIYNVIK